MKALVPCTVSAPVAASANAAKAKAALTLALKLSGEITGALKQLPMCRKAWRDYGTALLAARKLMPSTNEFGAWIKENGLDAGLASSHVLRSCAMWLAEHWDDVSSLTSLKNHRPDNLRQECRDLNYAWAFSERTIDKKRQATRLPAKVRHIDRPVTHIAAEVSHVEREPIPSSFDGTRIEVHNALFALARELDYHHAPVFKADFNLKGVDSESARQLSPSGALRLRRPSNVCVSDLCSGQRKPKKK